MFKVVELITTEKCSLLKRLSNYVYLAAKIQQNVERPWIEVMLLDTLIWFHSEARCPELKCIFCCEMYFRRRKAVPGIAVLVPSHAFMLISWWMTFIGSLGTSGWNLPMPDLLMSVPTTYPWATCSAIPAATAGTYPVLPAGNAMKIFSVNYHLWKLHWEIFHVSRCQLITVIVCYLCTFRLYGPVASNARIYNLNLNYMHLLTCSALAQVMACCLLGA